MFECGAHLVSVTHTGLASTYASHHAADRTKVTSASSAFRSVFIISIKLPEPSHLEALQL